MELLHKKNQHNFTTSLKDSAKGEYIEGRVIYTLLVQHGVTDLISFEYLSCL